MAAAIDSKSIASDGVWVRVPPPAPNKMKLSSKKDTFYLT